MRSCAECTRQYFLPLHFSEALHQDNHKTQIAVLSRSARVLFSVNLPLYVVQTRGLTNEMMTDNLIEAANLPCISYGFDCVCKYTKTTIKR